MSAVERTKRDPNVNTSRVTTFTGKHVDPLDLDPNDVCIEDIAHHLANQCRWTGATRPHYSVAQHSVLVSKLVPKEDAWDGLFHDSPEYILQDMAKPLKNHPELGRAYRQIEQRVFRVIAPIFGVSDPLPPSVHEVDIRMLVTEARDFVHGHAHWGYYQDIEPYDFTIKPWTYARAEREFLKRYEALKARREKA